MYPGKSRYRSNSLWLLSEEHVRNWSRSLVASVVGVGDTCGDATSSSSSSTIIVDSIVAGGRADLTIKSSQSTKSTLLKFDN